MIAVHALGVTRGPQEFEAIRVQRDGFATEASKFDACGSAWKKDPGSGVIGVEKGPLIPVV